VTHVNETAYEDLPTPRPPQTDTETPPSPLSENAQAEQLEKIVPKYDSPRFQSAHMGGVTLDSLRSSRITFQTAGASRDVIEWAVQTIGPERIVFGSDFPFYHVESELAKVQSLDIPQADQQRILSGNAIDSVLLG
jgi:hypothetical protein